MTTRKGPWRRATKGQLRDALRDVIENVLEDVPRATMTRHLVEAINDACELLNHPAPLTEDEDEDEDDA